VVGPVVAKSVAFGELLAVEAVASVMAELAFPAKVVVVVLIDRLAVQVTLQTVLQPALPPRLHPSSSSSV